MSLFKALFFFACFRGLFTESLHSQINNTKSSVGSVNVSDAELVKLNPGYNSTGNRTEKIEKPKRNLSSSEDHNSSATNPEVVFPTDSGCKEANENKSEHLRPTEDSRANSEQFPRRFWRGICDGMWWAVVTMATVGYGDKSPKSCFARLFATVWMVAGIVLLSMFTAQVSSRLTAQELKSDDHLVDKKIGVPRVLDGSDYVDDTMGFTIVEAIDAPNRTAEKLTEMKLDSILVFHCDDKIKDDKIWEVLQFMAPLHIGAEFYYAPSDGEPMEFDTEEKYIKCIKRTINAKCRKKNPGNKSRNSRSGHSCNKLNKEKLKFEFKWVYFKDLSQYLIPFGTMIGLIILCFIVGTVWDCCCQKRKNKFKSSDPEASQTGLILRKPCKEDERMLNNEVTSC
ncbi:uncharacterized protein [Montipora capricornis]|uniref:uncharacterized protein isoform X2 n=1 Tax=Montipora capricornis TaxID=246305 RepID=UPI0035F1F41D